MAIFFKNGIYEATKREPMSYQGEGFSFTGTDWRSCMIGPRLMDRPYVGTTAVLKGSVGANRKF
jgi:hypothetical protein